MRRRCFPVNFAKFLRTCFLQITFGLVLLSVIMINNADFIHSKISLREKCPKTELFLVCIFLYSDWIQENTDQKYLRIWTLFTQNILIYSLVFFIYLKTKVQAKSETSAWILPAKFFLALPDLSCFKPFRQFWMFLLYKGSIKTINYFFDRA